MALELLKKRIEEEAQRTCDDIRKSTTEETNVIREKADATIHEQLERYLQKSDEFIARMQTKEQLNTQLIVKKIVLAAKREILEQVFEEARARLHHDPDLYHAFIRAYMQEALQLGKRTVHGGPEKEEEPRTGAPAPVTINAEKILCNPAEIALYENALHHFNHPAYVQADASIVAGFMAENSEGTIRLDATMASVFEAAYQQSLQAVANILWQEDTAPSEAAMHDDAPDGAPGENARSEHTGESGHTAPPEEYPAGTIVIVNE